MFYFPMDWAALIGNYLVFLVLGLSSLILIGPKVLHNLWEETFSGVKIFFLVHAMGFASNAFLGYVLDIFLNLSWYAYLCSIGAVVTISYYFRKQEWIGLFLQIKKSLTINEIRLRYRWVHKNIPYLLFLIIILALFIINTWYEPLVNPSIPQNDPIYTFEACALSLKANHLVSFMNTDWVGIMNWEDRYYPAGFYLNMILLTRFGPENLYFLIKFFGPILSLANLLLIGLISYKITVNKAAALISMIAWTGTFINTLYSMLTVASLIGIFISLNIFSVIFKGKKQTLILSGVLFGGGFLIHTFAGGIFSFIAVIIGCLVGDLDLQEISLKKRIVWLVVPMLIILFPYIFLFQGTNVFSSIINKITFEETTILAESLDSNIKWGFIQDFSEDLHNFRLDGPPLWTILFLPFSAFSYAKTKQYWPIFWSLLLIGLLYYFNPFILNGVVLREQFDRIYIYWRGLWFYGLGLAFIIGICIDGIITMTKKILQYFKDRVIKENANQERWISLNDKLLPVLMMVLIIFPLSIEIRISSFYYFNGGYETHSVHNIPPGYTESWLYLGHYYQETLNAGEERNQSDEEFSCRASILLINETWRNLKPDYVKHIEMLHRGISDQIIPSYCEPSEFEVLLLNNITQYQFIIVASLYQGVLENAMSNVTTIFTSCDNTYHLYQTSTQNSLMEEIMG